MWKFLAAEVSQQMTSSPVHKCDSVKQKKMHVQHKSQMKKRSERREQCALAVVIRAENFSPRRRPLPEGAGRPKFNQLENLQTQFGEDRCTQFRVIVVTDPHTNTHLPTHNRQGQLQYTAPQLVRCKNKSGIFGSQHIQSNRHLLSTCVLVTVARSSQLGG